MIDGKLASILRMLDSPNDGEAANALALARRFMARGGITFGDLTRAVEAHVNQVPQPGSRPNADNWTDRHMRDVMRRAEEILRRNEEERRRKAAEESRRRAEAERHEAEAFADLAQERKEQRRRIVRKYGSVKRAKVPTYREAAVDAAATPFLCADHSETLAGWSGSDDPIPAQVATAIRDALPWPTTLKEAAAEAEFWKNRDDELAALLDTDPGYSALSLPCFARLGLIEDALAFAMRAASIADLAYRIRFGMARGWSDPRIADAVSRDIERLARAEVQNGQTELRQRRASGRHAAVSAILADPELAQLPDREVARRAGVSPSTVGNLRRKAAQGELNL